MKKLICLLLTVTMLLNCSLTALASTREEDEMKSTVLNLEENGITDMGNRHIKVTWEKVSDADAYKLEIANNENFENAVEKKNIKRNLYWNFAEVPGGEKDTYYIRIKPCFVYGESDDGYDYVYGQWSNVIVAEYEEKVIAPDKLQNIDFFPWIPDVDFSKLLKIDWSKIQRFRMSK